MHKILSVLIFLFLIIPTQACEYYKTCTQCMSTSEYTKCVYVLFRDGKFGCVRDRETGSLDVMFLYLNEGQCSKMQRHLGKRLFI